jgi:signal transduction histidine kinase
MQCKILQHFIEAAPVTVAMFDRDLRYMAASPRWLSEHKLSGPLIGRKADDVDPSQAALREFLGLALAGEWLAGPEDRRRLPDGSVLLARTRMGPWRGDDGAIGGIVVFIEMTESRPDPRSVGGAFLATLAHRLRNPLATVNLTIEMLEADASPNATARAALARARRQGLRLARMVDDLAEFSSLSQKNICLRKDRVDLGPLLAEAASLVDGRLTEKGVRLVLRLPETPLPVFGDPARLKQIIDGLLDNAVKFSQPGGRIDVEARARGADAIVTVRDNGVGIPPDQLATIFDFSRQTNPDHRKKAAGLGVSLALARQLLLLHGGGVEAHSDGPGKGSEFALRLPFHLD